jgi:hypothetical protein
MTAPVSAPSRRALVSWISTGMAAKGGVFSQQFKRRAQAARIDTGRSAAPPTAW